MSTTHATEASTESTDSGGQVTLEIPQEPDLERFTDHLSTFPGVQATPAEDAHCCGALNCRVTEYLTRLFIDGFGQRVLCPLHTVRLTKREVDSA